MSPGRIASLAGLTGGAPNSNILLTGDADEYLMLGDPDDFSASIFHVRNMFQHLRAENAVKRIVGKVQMGYIAGHSPDAVMLEAGLL
jgi:hypothetical protein